MPVLKVELFALGMLALCALAFSASVALMSASETGHFQAAAVSLQQVGFLSAMVFAFGFVPVALFGAPVYVGLHQLRWANWPSVILVGCAPGLVMLLFETPLGLYGLGFGVVVAALTHARFRHGF